MVNIDKERMDFEAWISSPPYERNIYRWSNDETRHAWPGQYADYVVEIAWQSRLARAEVRDDK